MLIPLPPHPHPQVAPWLKKLRMCGLQSCSELQWYPVVGVILKFLRCAKMFAASVFLAVACLSKLRAPAFLACFTIQTVFAASGQSGNRFLCDVIKGTHIRNRHQRDYSIKVMLLKNCQRKKITKNYLFDYFVS